MKKILVLTFVISIILTACGQPSSLSTPPSEETATPVDASTAESIVTPNAPPKEVITLPDTKITIENIGNVKEILGLGNGSITDVSASADSSYIAMSTYKEIVLFDVSGAVQETISKGAKSIDFSPDSQHLARFSPDGIYDLDVKNKTESLIANIYPDQYSDIKWSPDGQNLLAFSSDNFFAINVATGIQTTIAPEENVYLAYWLPDGNIIASLDNGLAIIDQASGKILNKILSNKEIWDFSISPNGSLLVASYGDETKVGVFDISSQKELSNYPDSYYLNWVTDDTFVSFDNGEILVTNITTKNKNSQDAKDKTILKRLSNGAFAAYSATNLTYFEFNSDNIKEVFSVNDYQNRIKALAENKETGRIVFVDSTGSVNYWDINTNEREMLFNLPESLNRVVISPNGQYIAAQQVKARESTDIEIFDVLSGQSIKNISTDKVGIVQGIKWSPNSSAILIRGTEDITQIIGINSNTSIEQLSFQSSNVCSTFYTNGNNQPIAAALSPDGSLIAIGDGVKINIIDTSTGAITFTLPGHTKTESCSQVEGLFWSESGNYLASTGDDNSLIVWDMETKSQIAKNNEISPLGWISLDGKEFLTGVTGGKVVLLTPNTLEIVASLPIAPDFVSENLVLSNDGTYIASGYFDGIVRIWGVIK